MIKDLPEYMKYLQFFIFFSDADGLKKIRKGICDYFKKYFSVIATKTSIQYGYQTKNMDTLKKTV